MSEPLKVKEGTMFYDDEGSFVGEIADKWFVPQGVCLTADELEQIAMKLRELEKEPKERNG